MEAAKDEEVDKIEKRENRESERRRNLRAYLCERDPETVILGGESCDDAIIGITWDCRLVYSYSKLVASFVKDGMTEDESREWIDSNVLRSIQYSGDHAPVVMYDEDGELMDILAGGVF